MEKEAFEILKNIEETWWHYGRIQAVETALSVAKVKKNASVLDVGSGYGGMFSCLSQFGTVDAVEPETEVALFCKQRGYKNLFTSESEALTAGNSYDIIGAFDVIEHVDDDKTFVSNLYKLTRQGGVLVATVPAFMWLWSEHDVHHMHFRRHTIGSMRTLLTEAGYEVAYARYWNVFLFPLAILTRRLGKGGDGALHPHPFVTSVLKSLLWIESKIVRFVPIPFGLSVVIVARKK